MRIILTSSLGLLCLVAPLSAQTSTYCIEGSEFTCFGFSLAAEPTAEGIRATIRLANLEGAAIPGVSNHVSWARVHGVALIAPTSGFEGGWAIGEFAETATAGSATEHGDTGERWLLWTLVDEDETGVRGYAVDTPFTDYGADIIGCTLPADQGFPYFRTCAAEGDGAVELVFSTAGAWKASDLSVVVVVQDRFADDMSCLIVGPQTDDPDAYRCLAMDDQPGDPDKLPASLALGELAHVYDGTPKNAVVVTTPEGLAGVSVTYTLAGAPAGAPTQAGSYGVSASLAHDDYEADEVTGTLVIDRAPQTILFAELPDRSKADGPFPLAATGGDSGAPVLFTSETTDVCTVEDGVVTLTGVGSCTIAANQAGDANHHPATEVRRSFQVHFAFAGFFRPVENVPTLNTVRAGRSVPLTFSLDGYQGLEIFAEGFPASRPVACDSAAHAEPLVETASPGQSTLSFDDSLGRYTYVWATDRRWTGCRELVLRLVDSSEHRAVFRF